MCDTIVIVEPGRVLFAKNSDRDPNEAQFLNWQPRLAHPAGSRCQATWIGIDQVSETHAVLLSRPFWMWGAEIGANEHGVTIGNEAVFTREPYSALGLTGMDLLRLGLERAETAAAAVGVITDLLEQHGQGGGCGHEHRGFTYHNSFIVADAGEAFVLETAGRHWATERVIGARSISNGLTIADFADRYSDRLRTTISQCRTRRHITEAAAGRASGVGDLMTALRDHGTDGPVPHYSPITGAMSAPCVHPGGAAAASQTTASWVAELTPMGAEHWVTASAAPCTGLFKPVSVTEPLDLGPEPVDRFDDRCLWWRHEVLHRAAMSDPARLIPRFAGERDEVEARWTAERPDPMAAFAEADRLLETWTRDVLGVAASDTRPLWVRRYWRTRNRRAGFPSVDINAMATRA